MSHAITWVEIPSTDFERAVIFYDDILGRNVRTGQFMETPHGFLDDTEGNAEGAIIPNSNPALYNGGPLIYLYVDNLDDALARVKGAGGVVLQPKTAIGPQGSIAVIRDTEGNCVGLHTRTT